MNPAWVQLQFSFRKLSTAATYRVVILDSDEKLKIQSSQNLERKSRKVRACGHFRVNYWKIEQSGSPASFSLEFFCSFWRQEISARNSFDLRPVHIHFVFNFTRCKRKNSSSHKINIDSNVLKILTEKFTDSSDVCEKKRVDSNWFECFDRK